MRKLSTTLAVIGILTPLGANALGIGEIKLRSSLNQSLNAEIPLVTSGAESLSDIRVSLAPPDAFARAGIERPYFLSKLHFEPIQKDDGSSVIKVTSLDAIHEPYLNFLIAVDWPQGRLLREFTVLVDPPASYAQGAAEPPELPEIEQAASRPEQTDYAGLSTPSSASVNGGSAPASDRAIDPAVKLSGSEYGPVQREATLWSIAKLLNADHAVTQEQMVLGLYRANPQSFSKDSANTLKAGETLKIPDRETLLSIPADEAWARVHHRPVPRGERVAEQREKKSAPLPETGVTTGEEQQAKLKLLTPSATKSKSEAAAAGGVKPETEAAKAKKDVALEEADTIRQENEEIRSRLAQLEQNLVTMQRLLTLKDEQIANLQSALQKQPEKPVEKPVPADEKPVSAAPAAVLAEHQPEVAGQPPQESPKAAATAAVPAATLKPAAVASPLPSVQPLAAAPHQTAEQEGLFSRPYFLGLAGAGTLALGLLAWQIKRRRDAMMGELESSFISAMADPAAARVISSPQAKEDSVKEQISGSAKNSFLTDFTPSDFDALDVEADELDPISEADVYLAYGRYKQAEELIRKSIEQNPDRDECKLKLLEIHYATENREAFEAYANALQQEGKDIDPEFWEKVADMGRELCPHSPLFGANATTNSQQQTFDLSAMEAELDFAENMKLEEDLIDELKNFDLREVASSSADSLASPARETATAAENEADEPALLDFDLANTGTQAPFRSTAVDDPVLDAERIIQFESSTERALDDGESFELRQEEQSLGELLQELSAHADAEPQADETLFEVDAWKKPGAPAEASEFDLELSHAAENLAPSLEKITLDDQDDYPELSEMDEIETKLDLAKAFVDMEDEHAAQQILEDVLKHGNEAQQTEAKAMLNKMKLALGS